MGRFWQPCSVIRTKDCPTGITNRGRRGLSASAGGISFVGSRAWTLGPAVARGPVAGPANAPLLQPIFLSPEGLRVSEAETFRFVSASGKTIPRSRYSFSFMNAAITACCVSVYSREA